MVRSAVRIWPPTQSFQLSPRHLFAEDTSATAAPYEGGHPGKVGAGRYGTLTLEGQRPPSPLQEQGAVSLWSPVGAPGSLREGWVTLLPAVTPEPRSPVCSTDSPSPVCSTDSKGPPALRYRQEGGRHLSGP